MILLDTNVISELMNPLPEPCVVRWLDSQPTTSLWTTSVSIFEIRFGLETMLAGKRRVALEEIFENWVDRIIGQRILSFDDAAAAQSATLSADRYRRGRPGELRDTMIAGIVLANNAKLATRNVRHFADIAGSVVNPWEAV